MFHLGVQPEMERELRRYRVNVACMCGDGSEATISRRMEGGEKDSQRRSAVWYRPVVMSHRPGQRFWRSSQEPNGLGHGVMMVAA